MPMQAENWRARPVTNSNIGADPNTSVSPLRQNVHSLASRAAGGKRFGDFEMDLIVDPHNHAILTIVERSTNLLFMTKLAHGKKTEPLAKVVRRLLLPYKKHIKTITTDNGPEFAAHKLITKQSIWERSSISPILMPHGKRER